MIPKRFLTLDTETIPNPDLPEECKPQFNEEDVRTGNLKDPIKIHEKMEQAKIKFAEDIDKTCSVSPDLCMVCCAVVAMCEEGKIPVIHSFSAADSTQEFTVITKTWDLIRSAYQEQIPIVGFNSMSFDIPVLTRRAMLSDISVAPGMIQNLLRRQEQNSHHYDLMQLLGLRSPFSGKLESKGLNYYLRLFGLGSKTPGVDGSMIFPMWKEGLHEEILAYCQTDVLKTAELFKRVAPWLITPAKEVSEKSSNGKDKAHEERSSTAR